ncbi:hypothetical protein NL676_033215 [Syzygium grande]|nr:hypothetical protein NL676_033215 [Syzygium grande]
MSQPDGLWCPYPIRPSQSNRSSSCLTCSQWTEISNSDCSEADISLDWDFDYNGTHSFAAVSKEDYDSCAKVSPIDEGSNGLGYGYRLPRKAGMYYFICTMDNHCETGQKPAINVTSAGFATWSPPSTFGALLTVICTLALFLGGH